jgi:hypothetical protein
MGAMKVFTNAPQTLQNSWQRPLRARGSGIHLTAFYTKHPWQILQIVYKMIIPGQ